MVKGSMRQPVISRMNFADVQKRRNDVEDSAKTRRRSRNPSARAVQHRQAPTQLTNVAGCTAFDTAEDDQREVVDYLRHSRQRALCPARRHAAGIRLCIFVNNRLSASARDPEDDLKHAL